MNADGTQREKETWTVAASITMALADYSASTSADSIPEAIRERAKKIIFDEMACARFGRRSAAGKLSAAYAQAFAGRLESRILGTNVRVSAPFAALANGAAGHGEEVDGAHVVGGHPGATLVHSAVAVAERQCSSGAELLNAVVLGYDVGVRLIAACGGTFVFQNRTHLHADFLHGIAASVSSSRLLEMSPRRICHAIAMSTFQTNGLTALFQEARHISKSFCNGQYAFAGVSAALMTSVGLEGCDDILGARDGVLEAWGGPEARAVLLGGLGSEYAVNGANFKFLNAGYPIHAAIEALIAIISENDISVEGIESVNVGMPANAMKVVNNRKMHNICVQDMLAATLIRRGHSLGDILFPALLASPQFDPIRARITVEVDPYLDREQPDGRGACVTVVLHNGQRHSRRVDHPRGHSERGDVTWKDLSEKWNDALPDWDVEGVISICQKLEHLDDTNELSAAMCI
jgi:2-methylcitrate dehydratase PrpD